MEAPYLLTREEAVRRYNIPLRSLVRLYRSEPDFPALHIGRSVRIHRVEADQWFTDRLRETITTDTPRGKRVRK